MPDAPPVMTAVLSFWNTDAEADEAEADDEEAMNGYLSIYFLFSFLFPFPRVLFYSGNTHNTKTNKTINSL